MISFKWDKPRVKKIDQAMANSLELTAEVLRDDVREAMVVPRDTGNLQNEAFTIDRSQSKYGIVRMNFNTPYARRLYFHPEYNFSVEENPNARGEWMKDWLPGGKYEKRAAEIFAKVMNREMQ